MLTLNAKNIVYSGSFSMKSGDEVLLTPPEARGHVFRFIPVDGTESGAVDLPVDVSGSQITLPVPLLDGGTRALDIEKFLVFPDETISLRMILQGAQRFTLVHLELHKYETFDS